MRDSLIQGSYLIASVLFILGLRSLTRLEEDERNAMIAQQRSKLIGEDRDVTPLLQLARIFRILEAQSSESHLAVKDTVPIEVDHVIRLLLLASPIEFLAQGW